MTPKTPTPDYGEPWHEQTASMNKGVHWLNTEQFNRAVSCVNACAGMADPAAEIEVMRVAIKEAASHLSGFLGFHAEALSLEQVLALSSTLKKIQSFLKP